LLGAVTVGLVGASYGYAQLKAEHGPDTPQRAGKADLGFVAQAAATDRPASARVNTVPVEVVRRSHTLRVTGSLAADEQSFVASYTNGIVSEIRVDRGSMVRKGDVLVQLDPIDAQHRLAEGVALVDELKAKVSFADGSEKFVAEDQPDVRLAKATLELATSRFRRAEELLPQKAIAVDEYDQYRSEQETAAQRYRQAILDAKQKYQAYQTNVVKLAALRKAVADTTIRAPFDGLIVEKNVAVGEQVTGGFIASKIVTLVRTNPLRVTLTVPQQSVGAIKPGQKVDFQVDSFPDRTFQAEVRYISPVVTSDTRSLMADAVVPNPDGLLRPGLFATAEIQLPEQQPELLVPASAVQRMDEVARVFVVRDQMAREQVVALGRTLQDKVEIRSGLTGQELLVARPELVRDGDRVSAPPLKR
jgi:RND family efflux transporter MFP subunit